MLVDTHCHLNHEAFAGGAAADAAARAASVGVAPLVVVGYDRASSEAALSAASTLPDSYAALGIHPHDARNLSDADVAWLRATAANPRVVAVGEIGLDFHYDFSPRDEQRAALECQLELADDADLPVIFHCREAYDELLGLLERRGAPRCGGVMHCWAGTPAEARRSLDLGLYLGVGGLLTFKTAGEVREAIAAAPRDRVVMETDAPYLAPAPFRGKTNEPAYLPYVAARLAELWGESVDRVAEITTANARALFPRLR